MSISWAGFDEYCWKRAFLVPFLLFYQVILCRNTCCSRSFLLVSQYGLISMACFSRYFSGWLSVSYIISFPLEVLEKDGNALWKLFRIHLTIPNELNRGESRSFGLTRILATLRLASSCGPSLVIKSAMMPFNLWRFAVHLFKLSFRYASVNPSVLVRKFFALFFFYQTLNL